MGDVLVKWRMAKIPTVVELVGELPKEKMPEELSCHNFTLLSIFSLIMKIILINLF